METNNGEEVILNTSEGEVDPNATETVEQTIAKLAKNSAK